jgi:hypothetical protein
MRFLVRLSNPRKYAPADSRRLTSLAYEAVRRFGGDIGNLRVSNSAVELDLILDSKTNLDKAIMSLEGSIGPSLTLKQLDVASPPVGNKEAIKLGLDLFNEERYWESHESLELVWRRSTGSEKEILQGIILLAVALVHLQKNEFDVTLSVMERAYGKLAAYDGEYFGISISILKEQVAGMLSSRQPEFLKIEAKN